MSIQIITTPSGERLVVLPEADFTALVDAAEDNADRAAVSDFRRKLADGQEELIPSEIVDRLLGGENRIKVWRDFRGLTSATLAEQAGMAQSFLSQIETGKRDGTIDTLLRIANVLRVTLDDIANPGDAPERTGGANHKRIEDLVQHKPGLTEAEIAIELFGENGYQQQVNADCRWLKKQLRVDRRGRGGPGDPYRYHPVAAADRSDEAD